VVQPLDYSIRSTAQGPLQALSQGMQLGQQFARIEEAREAAKLAQQMETEKQRIEAEKLRQAQEAAAANQRSRRSGGCRCSSSGARPP
jgi:inhibitor of KinA sporulation pathway (predicted exonuclease)